MFFGGLKWGAEGRDFRLGVSLMPGWVSGVGHTKKPFDLRLRARTDVTMFWGSPFTTSVPSEPCSEAEPMQLGRIHEHQCWIQERLCLYCGSTGHFVATCPVKDKAPSRSGSTGDLDSSIPILQVSHHDNSHSTVRWGTSSVSCLALIDGWRKFHRATAPVSLTTCGNHQETITFLVFQSPMAPIFSGHPWWAQHNPQINWADGSILSCSLSCHVKCLVSFL